MLEKSGGVNNLPLPLPTHPIFSFILAFSSSPPLKSLLQAIIDRNVLVVT